MLKITVKGTSNESITITVPLEDFSMKKEPDGATTLRYKGGSATYPSPVRVTIELSAIAPELPAS